VVRSLLQRTSVVTLSICGIFKEVITISAAAVVFHDPLTPVNLSGLLITIVSIAAYNYIKIKKMREEAVLETVIAHQHGEHHRDGDSGDDAGTRDWYAPIAGAEPPGDEETVDEEHGSQTRNRVVNAQQDQNFEVPAKVSRATNPGHSIE
jgi:hypothetical protein